MRQSHDASRDQHSNLFLDNLKVANIPSDSYFCIRTSKISGSKLFGKKKSRHYFFIILSLELETSVSGLTGGDSSSSQRPDTSVAS